METESDPHCPDFSHRADRRRHSANPFGLSVVIPPPLPRNRRIITTTRRNSGLGSATWTCPGCGLILRYAAHLFTLGSPWAAFRRDAGIGGKWDEIHRMAKIPSRVCKITCFLSPYSQAMQVADHRQSQRKLYQEP
eukprot:1362028-Amorphochlora_amoeboformis.AAC.2